MLSFTRRNGSFTEQRWVASQFPWFVTHEVISTGPSIAEITSNALICDGSFDNWYPPRSEEHTSELQSQSNLVCRLLLEKKKKTNRYRLKSPTLTYSYAV